MKKWAIVNDWHIPKHDKQKVDVWMKIMKDWQPDAIDFNGDFANMESVGRWVRGQPEEHAERVAIQEAAECREHLEAIRDLAPDAEIVFREGNHEARLEDYIAKNAPALVDLVNIRKLFYLDDLEIAHRKYSEAPDKRFGGFYLHHGTYTDVSKEMDKYLVSMIVGHSHRLRSERRSGLELTLDGHEGGHMVDLTKVDYMPHFDWQHGFLYGYYNDNDAWIFQAQFKDNTVIFDGVEYGG